MMTMTTMLAEGLDRGRSALAVLRGFCEARRTWTAAEVRPLWAEAERVVAKRGGRP